MVPDLGQARISRQMVSVWFLSSQHLVCRASVSSCVACCCSGACVCVCVVGWMGAVLCGLLSVVGFCASARDIHGEEGMILGLWVVPRAFQLRLGAAFFEAPVGFLLVVLLQAAFVEVPESMGCISTCLCWASVRRTGLGASAMKPFQLCFLLSVILILLVVFSGFCCSENLPAVPSGDGVGGQVCSWDALLY